MFSQPRVHIHKHQKLTAVARVGSTTAIAVAVPVLAAADLPEVFRDNPLPAEESPDIPPPVDVSPYNPLGEASPEIPPAASPPPSEQAIIPPRIPRMQARVRLAHATTAGQSLSAAAPTTSRQSTPRVKECVATSRRSHRD